MNARRETLGIIGCGAMGTAIALGVSRSGLFTGEHLLLSDREPSRAARLARLSGGEACQTNAALVDKAEVIVMAVKPDQVESVLGEVTPQPDQLWISVAAGITLDFLRQHMGGRTPLVRAMPNTPCLVGAGITALCPAEGVSRQDLQVALEVFTALGQAIEVEEKYMDAVTAVSGSGPAYVALVAESMIDGGVAAGLPRSVAEKLVFWTIEGSAKLLRKQEISPYELKNRVMSPGGTTASAVCVLEVRGVRGAFIDAVEAARRRAAEL